MLHILLVNGDENGSQLNGWSKQPICCEAQLTLGGRTVNWENAQWEFSEGQMSREKCPRGLFRENFLGEFHGCPDPHAELQASTCSSCDLATEVNTHEQTDRETHRQLCNCD